MLVLEPGVADRTKVSCGRRQAKPKDEWILSLGLPLALNIESGITRLSSSGLFDKRMAYGATNHCVIWYTGLRCYVFEAIVEARGNLAFLSARSRHVATMSPSLALISWQLFSSVMSRTSIRTHDYV